jgi:hypothetical protein
MTPGGRRIVGPVGTKRSQQPKRLLLPIDYLFHVKEDVMQAVQRNGIGTFIHRHFYTLLMLMLAGGFAMLVAELLLTEHTDGIQLVAVAASVAGLLLTLAALFVRGRGAMMVAILLLLLSATGVLGAYEHFASAEEESARRQPTEVNTQQVALRTDSVGDNDAAQENSEGAEADKEGGAEGEAAPPPLAPLSLVGLSWIGALAVVGLSNKES